MTQVSILILTLNEEINIGECIDSCAWSNDIVVFDSVSTDRTREISTAKGARVVERRFDNYAAQRNAALTTISYKNPWVLMVDADERVPPDLAAEIASSLEGVAPGVSMFRMRRKDFFLGKWIKRSSGYPTWFGRLVRIGHIHVEREYNEEYLTDGEVKHLQTHLEHLPFNRGIAYWFERHNRYSTMEAQLTAKSAGNMLALGGVFSSDPTQKRRTLKQIANRLPLRPLLVFLYLYVLRLGFLDGRAGFYFSSMRASYEMFIDLKVFEVQRRQRGLPV